MADSTETREKQKQVQKQNIAPSRIISQDSDFPVLYCTNELPQHVLSATEIKMVM